jgi:hypothetical protein
MTPPYARKGENPGAALPRIVELFEAELSRPRDAPGDITCPE